MRISPLRAGRIVAVLLAFSALAALTTLPAPTQTDPAKTFGSAWSPPLGAWLPDPDTGFDAWSKHLATVTTRYDYFVCGPGRTPAGNTRDFYYPGSACAPLKNGTYFVYGTAEPIKSHVVYDRAHGVALYDKGCCAWRGFALAANVAPPPKTVVNGDLSAVRTMRGVTLDMTQAQVERIYGSAKPHAAKGRPGMTTLSYTTMKGGPNGGGDACGQFQGFTFRQGRLVSIELLTGC